MMYTSLQELTVRMERLERENKLLKHGGALLVMTCAAILALGFARPDTRKSDQPQETSSLVLKDAEGTYRGWLVVHKDGIGLAFGDAGGVRSGLVLDANGANLKCYDRNGTTISGVGLQESGVSVAARGIGQKPIIGLDALIYDVGSSISPDPIFDHLGKKPGNSPIY